MFGFGKPKNIDVELLIENLSSAVIKLWADSSVLAFDKFMNTYFFDSNVAENPMATQNFMREKLRFLTGCSLISLWKTLDREDVAENLITEIKHKADNTGTVKKQNITTDLGLKAKWYSEIWRTNSPKEAGKKIELGFCKGVFGAVPRNDDVDSNYILYKQLSNLQRKYIFAGGAAIRNSNSK